jgi:hypothetical protein
LLHIGPYCRAFGLLFVAILFITGVERLTAQLGADSKGKAFWVTFMANNGSGGNGESSDMRLYLSCQRPTTAYITFIDSGQRQRIPIPIANRPVEVDINSLFRPTVELSDVSPFDRQGEITAQSFYVEADDEITLYGVSVRLYSADAFMGLPEDVLSPRYIVLAYQNGYLYNGQSQGTWDMPSEFAVIATKDNTTLRVTPSPGVSLNGRPNIPFSVVLNRGQVFFAQAGLGGPQDVTGTELLADHPIAVFAGCKRTSVPTRYTGVLPRDHLVEQLPPLDAWGKSALAVPHFPVTPASKEVAIVRILPAYRGTDVTVTSSTSTQVYTLSTGTPLDLQLTGPMNITATQPILVAQYEHSVGERFMSGGFGIGDPFMMLVPPVEQFDTSYAFQSVEHPQFPAPYHYINVVIPRQGIGSLRLDGARLNATFRGIPGSNYEYAQINVTPGAHYIAADSAFGLYVYGFGSANSYGYPGGMLFRRLIRDFEAPDISWSGECGLFQGFASDSRISDSGIDSCYATKDTVNVNVTILPFLSGVDTVFFVANIIDPYQDGTVAIRAVDSSGLSVTQKSSLPGFTLRVAGVQSVPAVIDTIIVINAPLFCKAIAIRNYGTFPQTITSARLLDSIPGGMISTPMPVVIAPGEQGMIEVCFANLGDTALSSRLQINGQCATRIVAIVPVDSRLDTAAPGIGREGPPCADEFVLTYSKQFRASRISTVDVDTVINGSAEIITAPTEFPAQLVRVRLRRSDPRRDMIYQITVEDSVGNRVIDRDTVGGFTLAVLNSERDTLGVRVNAGWTGDTLPLLVWRCDSLELTNYGLRTLDLHRVRLRGNILYSIPPSQLPMVLQPGESRRLSVCIEGKEWSDETDTLEIFDACDHNEVVALLTPVRYALGAGADQCSSRIGVSTYAPAKRTFLTTPMPNPAMGSVHVAIGLHEGERVGLEVFDLQGNRLLRVLEGVTLPAGVTRVDFELGGLPEGSYYCRMTTERGEVMSEKLVVQR